MSRLTGGAKRNAYRVGIGAAVLCLLGAAAATHGGAATKPADHPSSTGAQHGATAAPPATSPAASAATGRPAGTSEARNAGAEKLPAKKMRRPKAVTVPTGARLRHPMHGKAAVRALGTDLATTARQARLTSAQLRHTLLTDPTMWVGKQGQLYSIDPAPAGAAAGDPVPRAARTLATPKPRFAQQMSSATTPAADDVFSLHSNPGAPVELYLDFTGASVQGTAWNNQYGLPSGSVPAWDPAGDGATTWSADETNAIREIWQRVSEDYAPFDVDVTTHSGGADALHADTSDDPTYGTTVVITSDTAEWDTLCHEDCGGIANVGSLGQVDPEGRADYAWVFGAGLSESPESVAEAAAHEAGHTFGLTHQGDQPNTDGTSYDLGHHLWAPIMGAGYYHAVTQWAKGEYAGANNQQDELAQIEKVVSVRSDEAGNTPAAASAVPSGSAYITDQSDTDVYALGSCASNAEVSAVPAAVGADLDLHLTVVDSTGETIADVDPADTETTVAAPVAWDAGSAVHVASGLDATAAVAGDTGTAPYFLEVRDGGGQAGGAGDPSTDFDTYGSLGAYTVSVRGCSDPATAPSAPIRLSGRVTADGLSASWQAPNNDGGVPISGYQVSVDGGAWNAVSTTSYADGTITTGAHTVAVRAVNAVGPGPNTSGSAQSSTIPGAPQLYGTPQVLPSCDFAPNLQCFEFFWTAPANDGGSPIISFKFSVDGYTFDPVPVHSGGLLAVYGEEVNLSPGYPSDIRITAVNAVGEGAPLDFSGLIPGPPMPIMGGFTVSTDRVARTATVTWPTPFDGGAAIQGYRIWYGNYPSGNVAPDAETTDNTWTFHHVKYPGKQVWVSAYNSYGNTNGPGSVFVDMPERSPLPGQVSGFALAPHARTGSVDVSWDALQIPAPDAVVGYDVCVMAEGYAPTAAPPPGIDALSGEDTGDMDVCGDGTKATWTTTPSATVTGLTPGAMYIASVQAVNPGGPGGTVTSLLIENDPADPVGNLQVTPALAYPGTPSITATWTQPAYLGGATDVDHYEVRLDTAEGDGTWQRANGSTSNTWSTAYGDDLAPGDTYTVDVRVVTAGVYSSHFTSAVASQTATIPTTVGPAPPPPIAPGNVINLVATADPVARTVTVTWAPPADNGAAPITGYYVMIDNGSYQYVPASQTSYTFEDVTTGPHTVVVDASNGAWPDSLTDVDVTMPAPPVPPAHASSPGVVTALKVSPNPTHGSATVSWRPPGSDGGSPVTGYVITLGTQHQSVGASVRTLTFSGLRVGTPYAVSVVAANAAGQGLPARGSVLLRTTPGAPKVTVARGAKKAPLTITVGWQAAAANGAAVTGYQVRIETLNAHGKVTRTATYSATAAARTMAPRLKAGTYKVSVRASNAVGWGAFSPWSVTVSPR